MKKGNRMLYGSGACIIAFDNGQTNSVLINWQNLRRGSQAVWTKAFGSTEGPSWLCKPGVSFCIGGGKKKKVIQQISEFLFPVINSLDNLKEFFCHSKAQCQQPLLVCYPSTLRFTGECNSTEIRNDCRVCILSPQYLMLVISVKASQ